MEKINFYAPNIIFLISVISIYKSSYTYYYITGIMIWGVLNMFYIQEDDTFITAQCEHCSNELKINKTYVKNGILQYPIQCNTCKESSDKISNVPIRCPKCGSSNLTANNKGFGVGKAVIGGAILGPVGLLGGFVGSSKVKVTCLQCGNQWTAGK